MTFASTTNESVPNHVTIPDCSHCITSHDIIQMVLQVCLHRLAHGLTGDHIACRTTLSVPETAGDFWMLFSKHIAPHLLEGRVRIVLLDQSAVL